LTDQSISLKTSRNNGLRWRAPSHPTKERYPWLT
jgi:hypothetical protein